ncbi:MAG: MBL fold metallo-hydrolase [Rectinema sp.]|nr:MBL fold metallo-hydrolase [Rectinema sp.]
MKIYQHYSIFGFSNSYIIGNDDTQKALIVDPAELTPTMIEKIEQNRYQLEAILITHSHDHHIRGLTTIMKIYNPIIYASNARLFSFSCHKVRDGDLIEAGGFSIQATAIPGHSQDSIVYLLNNLILFTGDVLHAGLIGKTNSAFNTNALAERIREKLFSLPGEILIFPGHGPPSTIETERNANISFEKGFADQTRHSYDFFV